MKISIIGTGYVGLVTGTCFAESGNVVTCVDIDEKKIQKLRSGKLTIYEPGLGKLFDRNLKEGRLKFTTNIKDGFKESKIIFLALPTPPDEDGSADLKYILGVAENIGELLLPGDYKIIIDKSTVPVGTSEKVHKLIANKLKERKIKNGESLFDVASNPEFLREGVAVEDFMKPSRVIIGTRSEKVKRVLSHLYAPFVRQGNPVIYMDERSAELTKYAANSFLATKISFMNEVAQLCERVGADINMVRTGMASDDRIGKRFLFAGIGYGGSCFPKDVQALWKSSQEANYEFKIMDAVMKVNKEQKSHLIPKILKFFNNNLKGKKIALWGLSFKPNTDDIREAPSLVIIDALLKEEASVTAYDPEAMGHVKKIYGKKINFAQDQYDTLKGADALVIATEWSEFRTPDFSKMKLLMKEPVIFDGRNVYDEFQIKENNFHYEAIGRAVIARKSSKKK